MPALIEITQRLSTAVDQLTFAAPVSYVYNPLDYAWVAHEQYLQRYGQGQREVVFLGMNPGPFGMAQTGVPFGDVSIVRDWLKIEAPVRRPEPEHPKRPVQGFDCKRTEVSGSRLWGWAQDRFGAAENFFTRFYVVNYCPLVFMQDSGRNHTPDKLPKAEREALYNCCNQALRETIAALNPEWVIGIGKFAESRAGEILDPGSVKIGVAPHPSPASPAANRGWAPLMDQALAGYGLL